LGDTLPFPSDALPFLCDLRVGCSELLFFVLPPPLLLVLSSLCLGHQLLLQLIELELVTALQLKPLIPLELRALAEARPLTGQELLLPFNAFPFPPHLLLRFSEVLLLFGNLLLPAEQPPLFPEDPLLLEFFVGAFLR
jgi:hypothetical protein